MCDAKNRQVNIDIDQDSKKESCKTADECFARQVLDLCNLVNCKKDFDCYEGNDYDFGSCDDCDAGYYT